MSEKCCFDCYSSTNPNTGRLEVFKKRTIFGVNGHLWYQFNPISLDSEKITDSALITFLDTNAVQLNSCDGYGLQDTCNKKNASTPFLIDCVDGLVTSINVVDNLDGTYTWNHNLGLTNPNDIDFNPFLVVDSTADSITFDFDGACVDTMLSIHSLDESECDVSAFSPIARITSNFVGGNFGTFQGSFELTEIDGTHLQTGDEVTLQVISSGGISLGSATFSYGDDISNAIPLVDNNFVANLQPYIGAGSLIQDGGSYTFLKKPFSFDWSNANAGKLAGINKGEDLIFTITANDVSEGLKSANLDNYTALTKVHESVFYASSVSRAASLPGITPNNPNPTFDYTYVAATGNAGHSVSDLLSVSNPLMNYGHYYNNTSGVLENSPIDSVSGSISKASGFYAPGGLVSYWITLSGTTNNSAGFYKRHRISVGIDNYPNLVNQNISNNIESVTYIKNTKYRICTSLISTLNTPVSTSQNINYSILTYSFGALSNATNPPSLFTKVETWVSNVPNQDPLLGTQLANYVGNNANQINTFTSAGDGEYIILTRGLDASDNVISYSKSLLIQISY